MEKIFKNLSNIWLILVTQLYSFSSSAIFLLDYHLLIQENYFFPELILNFDFST